MRRFPVLLVLGCVLSSCDRGTSAPSPVPTEVIRQARVPSAEVERLEALGYVDVDEAQDGRTGVVVRDAARSYPGYNVFTNAHLCSTQLVDAQGALVHSWSIAPCFRWDNTSLFPNGDLLVVGRATPPAKDDLTGAGASSPTGRYVARIGWSGEVMWQKWLPAHHDAQLTPHGEIAVLTERRRVVPGTDSDRKIKDHAVTLLSMAGETVGEASLYDLLASAPPEQFRFRESPQARRGRPSGRRRGGKADGSDRGRRGLDVLHANSVFWMSDARLAARAELYSLSNVVVTLRHQDAVVVIDWARKKVVWAWGQDELSGPHDAVVLPSGNILIFDNGLARGWSRVVEVDPMTRRIVWQYRAAEPETFFTLTRGASQRLPNGNTLIAQSGRGRAFEVTRAGEIVWEFLNPNLTEHGRGAIVRMRRVEPAVVEAWLTRDRVSARAEASGAGKAE